MERAEAIEILDRIALRNVFCTLDEEPLEAFWMATEALREQEQREQGCEVCSHGKYLTAIFTDQNGGDRLMLFKFCPNCGRKMPED